jgi:hypothetical protein
VLADRRFASAGAFTRRLLEMRRADLASRFTSRPAILPRRPGAVAPARTRSSFLAAFPLSRLSFPVTTRPFEKTAALRSAYDPVVHADVQQIKQNGGSQQADAAHGLPGQARQ